MDFKTLLQPINLNACQDAIDWVGDKTLAEAWAACERGDWMLWLYERASNYDKRKAVLAGGHCASTVFHLTTDRRSQDGVKACIDYGYGLISDDELRATSDAASAASAASAARAAWAAWAASATSDAASAASAASAAWTAESAAWAARAAAWAAWTAESATWAANQRTTADICRMYLPVPEFKSLNI